MIIKGSSINVRAILGLIVSIAMFSLTIFLGKSWHIDNAVLNLLINYSWPLTLIIFLVSVASFSKNNFIKTFGVLMSFLIALVTTIFSGILVFVVGFYCADAPKTCPPMPWVFIFYAVVTFILFQFERDILKKRIF